MGLLVSTAPCPEVKMRQFVAVLALAGVCLSRPHVNSGVPAGPLTPAVGDLVATPKGYRSFALEGFSEDLNQDGFVDPIGQAVPVVQHMAPLINSAPAPAVTYAAVKAPPAATYAAADVKPDKVKSVDVTAVPVDYSTAALPYYAPVPVQNAVPRWPIPYSILRSINGCPYQVKVQRTKGTDDTKGPYKLLKKLYGTYTIQLGTVNGRDWYKKDGTQYAIWYSGSRWIVGTEDGLGSSGAIIYTDDDDKCPHQPGYTWKYYVPAIGNFVDAGKSMSMWENSAE